MSEEDDFLSEESYEFEFEEDDDNEEIQEEQTQENSPQNLYYQAKGLKEDSLNEAADKFEKLIANADGNNDTEWVFKAFKQLAKIHYQKQEYSLVLNDTKELMYLLPELNGNYAEESISKILSRYATSHDHAFVSSLYDVIVDRLQNFISSGTSGQRLWLRININRLNNLLEMDDVNSCIELINSINAKMETVSESTRNSYALDIIAAEIIYVMKTSQDPAKLSQLYDRSLCVTPAITHPQVMGVVKECGATVQFFKGNYDKARVEYYECFKSYDEAGSSSRNKILKYLIICCLIVESEVNPFKSQETQSYAQLPEYQNLISLVEAYERLDLTEFINIQARMKIGDDTLSTDPIFVASQNILLHNFKMKMVLNIAIVYSSITFDRVIEELQLNDDDDLEQLLFETAAMTGGSHFKINFSRRSIQFRDQDSESLSLDAIEEATVRINIKALHRISYAGPWSAPTSDLNLDLEDARSSTTQLNALLENDRTRQHRDHEVDAFESLFCNCASEASSSSEQDDWVKYMRTDLLQNHRCTSLQNYQKGSAQHREITEELDYAPENEEAAANTSKGILNSVTTDHTTGASQSIRPRSKIGTLFDWVTRLTEDVGNL
ncbi:hypothetical protein OXX59_000866 [Metschnikowia pulcherrima]